MVDYITLILLSIILIYIIFFSIIFFLKIRQPHDNSFIQNIDNKLSILRSELNNSILNIQSAITQQLTSQIAMESTKESEKIDLLITSINNILTDLKVSINSNNLNTESKLESMRSTLERNISNLQLENTKKLEEINRLVIQNLTLMSQQMLNQIDASTKSENEKIDLLIKSNNEQLNHVLSAINTNTSYTENKLESIRTTLDSAIKSLQNENTKKLDEIRLMVDEKLQKTLEERLTQSFKNVSDSLNQVYASIGEMQQLAAGVGDLKKVLSNVKTRGILGEMQLGAILEEILSPEQYVKNFATKKGSRDPVEFAIKLPGDNNPVYLPIDAKFPLDTYENLLDAYDSGNSDLVKDALNKLINVIKKFAKDISEKYIDVPNTTDFGIMFLPIEGLYAEVVKSGVTEILQRDYKINIAGPTTMAALLNSLRMGFNTLTIQKRSSEVWEVLGAVKTEFSNFEGVLKQMQNRLNQASDELEKLVGVRTRKIMRTLKEVTALPTDNVDKLIDLDD